MTNQPDYTLDAAWESMDDDLLETMGRVLRATTPAELLAMLQQGLAEVTGASILSFERLPDGTFALAAGSDTAAICPPGQEVAEAGETLAQRLPNLLTSAIGPSGTLEGALFTNLHAPGDQAPAARDLGNLGDLFTTNAVAVAPLCLTLEPLGALIGIWPETTPAGRVMQHSRRFLRCGQLAGPALHRLVLLGQLERRVAEGETIRRLTDSIARTPRFHEALDIICRTSQLVTGADFVAISETTTDHVIWHSVCGAMDPSFLHARLPIPYHILSEILHHRQEVVLEDVRNHPELKPDIMPIHTRENLRSSVVVPVYVNARLRAIVVFASRRLRAFSPDELATFHSLAGTTATAIAASDARMSENE